jgi:4,5-dihydroxyphthalate decarboxylase
MVHSSMKLVSRYCRSRRNLIKAVAMAGSALGFLGPGGLALAQTTARTKKLPLKMAGYKFDRVAALVDGRVDVKGCDVGFETAAICDMNTDVFSGPQTRDVTEIGLHPFMLAYANEGFRDYTLLPIFSLRMFRHRSVFVRSDRSIKKPEDLRGRKIATPGYSSTSLTWIRGIFQDEYGISPRDVQWIAARKDSSAKDAGKVSKQENILPNGVPITQGPDDKDESDLLVGGEVDALFHAAEPRAYIERHPKVARLFPDYRTVERAYFAKTGIFPIMHVVAIRRKIAQDNPRLVQAVFSAYAEAKRLDYEYMTKSAWIFESLPWYAQELEETRALMGDNFDSYGIAPNRKTLEALFRYSYQQGLAKRELKVDELFHPASLNLFERAAR